MNPALAIEYRDDHNRDASTVVVGSTTAACSHVELLGAMVRVLLGTKKP